VECQWEVRQRSLPLRVQNALYGIELPVITSHTQKNLGRRLIGCSKYIIVLLLSCFVSDRKKHHCTVSKAMLP
jgi:hypothetical protein